MEKSILEVEIGDKIKPFKEEFINEYNKQIFEVLGKIKKITDDNLLNDYIKINLKDEYGEINEYIFYKNLIVKIEE